MTGAAPPDEPGDSLDGLQRRLEAWRARPDEGAEGLAGIEASLLAAPERSGGPGAGPGVRPALAAAARWAERARDRETGEAADAAERLRERLIEDEADRIRAGHRAVVEERVPAAAFRALLAAVTFDLEALGRRRGPAPLADARALLRAALHAAVEESAPPDTVRDAWTDALVDRANVVLTGVDDLEPDRAAAQLALVADELEHHARRVEPGRSRRRARLRLKARRLRAEQQERELQHRLEARFGTAVVAGTERLVLVLILLVLGLLAYEALFMPSMREALEAGAATFHWRERTVRLLAWIDTAACAVFLTEFFVKLSMVRGKGRWFVRHFLVDFLPSIPFGLIVILRPQALVAADATRAGRVVRLARVSRVTRYLRAARPFIRLFRALGFLTRGTDRIVRGFGPLINRDVLLYPTREERLRSERENAGTSRRLRTLQATIDEAWERLLDEADDGDAPRIVAARVAGIERARAGGAFSAGPGAAEGGTRPDVTAEQALRVLATLTPAEVEAQLGADLVARIARAVRMMSWSPLRFFPVWRHYIPPVGRRQPDAEVVCVAAHRVARHLERRYRIYLWFADLHGTITPAEFVDRVGTTLFRGAMRPAYRLALFGLGYLLVSGVLDLTQLALLERIKATLDNIVGETLVILGSICVVILGVGAWLRRIAGQATDFFAQSAKAQHLALTEAFKSRSIGRDAAILDRHVFRPERRLAGREDGPADRERFVRGVREWLVEAQMRDDGTRGFDPVERAMLLYRDGLDGALLVDSDTRMTSQLLGNPSLRNLRLLSARYTRGDWRALQGIDLERQRSMVRGPYVWFTLVCQAVAHGAARLIVDYNRHALSLDQHARASARERDRFEAWLGATRTADVPSSRVVYATTEFHALHFLDDDPRRDAEVEQRYGPRVLARLHRDRRLLFRGIFGTWPLHLRAREQRTVNLARSYQLSVAGGRALLLPLRAVWAGVRFAGRFLLWLRRCVREIRRPGLSPEFVVLDEPDFTSAARKIQRMRGPAAEAGIRLRAVFDAEYLGVGLPGVPDPVPDGADARADLRFVGPQAELERDVERARERAESDLRRLGRLLADGLADEVGHELGLDAASLGAERRRAAAVAYVGDLRRVRTHLSAQEILEEVCERAVREPLPPRWTLPRWRLARAFRRWWRDHGQGDRDARRAAWRAVRRDRDGAREALRLVSRLGRGGARAKGVQLLARLLRHPERVTDQLVTLRAVQTLTLIDLLNYREHVWRLGRYAEGGPPSPHLLDLR